MKDLENITFKQGEKADPGFYWYYLYLNGIPVKKEGVYVAYAATNEKHAMEIYNQLNK